MYSVYVLCARFLKGRNIFIYISQKPNILQHKHTLRKTGGKKSLKEGGFGFFLVSKQVNAGP